VSPVPPGGGMCCRAVVAESVSRSPLVDQGRHRIGFYRIGIGF
jgi:hypothetical protein